MFPVFPPLFVKNLVNVVGDDLQSPVRKPGPELALDPIRVRLFGLLRVLEERPVRFCVLLAHLPRKVVLQS